MSDDEVLADRLPKVLASRLRAARNAVGLSQGAVAKAMVDRGFSWRQTTVAKSEAADRPVLFAEVGALAQIYKREIEYFLYPGTELDSLLDEALSEMAGIQDSLRHTENMLSALKSDLGLYERLVGVASAIRRYRSTSDSGPLLADLEELLQRWGYRCLTLRDVFESIEVTGEQLAAVDREALTEAARVEVSRYQGMSEMDMMYESTELLVGLGDFLEGKEVPEVLIGVLRGGGVWVSVAVPLLADLVISSVDSQRD